MSDETVDQEGHIMENLPAPPPPIHTPRLLLIPLSAHHLHLYLADPAALESDLAVPLSRAILTDRVRGAIAQKLARMAAVDPTAHPWYTYWLAVVRDTSFGAGLLGFKGTPDAEGVVEIGYGLDPAYRGQGYTTEAARALIDWAFRDPACRAVVAPGTMKANVASNRVLAKLGMRLVGQSETANDWRLDRAGWRFAP